MFSGKKAISTVAVIVLAFGMLLTACGNDLSANTMRLLKTEGIVKLEVDGVEQEFVGDQRLADGNALKTEVASLASIGLDDTKIVTLDESSRAQFHKDGKKLALDLTDGSVFFQVSKKLEDDETFEIGTTDTMVGIRGTSGVVSVNDKGRYSLYLTDGEIEIKARNPETGEEKTQKVKAPAKVSVYLYSDRPMGQTLEFVEVPLEPDMLPPFAVNQIYSDEELMTKITEQTGWTVTDISKVHDQIEDGSYEPATSDALQLGLAEPDDIAKKMGLVAEEPEEPETPAEQPEADQDADDDQDSADADQPEEAATAADGRQQANAQTAPSAPNSLGVAYIREDGIWVLTDGTLFDPAFYAASDPEVVKAFGNDPNALLQHYLLFGRYENRPTYLSEEVRAQQELEAKNQEVLAQLLWAQINAQNQAPAPEPVPAPVSHEIHVLRNGEINCSASASATSAPAGTVITLTATPSEGNIFERWIIEGDGFTLADASAATTTFTMPDSEVTVIASFITNPIRRVSVLTPSGYVFSQYEDFYRSDFTYGVRMSKLSDTLFYGSGYYVEAANDITTGVGYAYVKYENGEPVAIVDDQNGTTILGYFQNDAQGGSRSASVGMISFRFTDNGLEVHIMG